MKSKIDTLLDIIEHVRYGTCPEIDALLQMGFSPCQLVYVFGYNKDEVKASEHYNKNADDNLETKEYPFVLGNYTSYDSSIVNHFQLHENEFLAFQDSELYARLYEDYKEEREEALREVENDLFYKYEEEIYDFIKKIRTTPPRNLTDEIKKLGFGNLICTSFEEARENERKKNIVIIDNAEIYLTFKYNDKFGELVSWGEDELSGGELILETVLNVTKEIYSLSDDEIARRIKDDRFLLIFAEY